MAEGVTSYIVENDEAFARALQRLSKVTKDFRIPFGQIAKEFYKSNRKIFLLKGPGLYPDFKNTKSRAAKRKAVGFEYPLLVRTGRLASSLVNPSDPETVKVIKKNELQLGTTVPYAIFHQSDKARFVIPKRKMVFIDGGPLEPSIGAKISGRRETWLNLINDYILAKLDEVRF